jgi:disulfide bond formation protein DsbB
MEFLTKLLSPRTGNLVGFFACTGMMAFALYSQHFLGLEPCPLCIFQRVAVIALGALFLIAGIHGAGKVGGRVYAALMALVALAGSGVSARHVWLQTLPPDKVPSCGPGLDFMLETFPLTEVLNKVLSGSGECAEIAWSLFGLSMPAWTLIALLGSGVFAVIVNLRLAPARNAGV